MKNTHLNHWKQFALILFTVTAIGLAGCGSTSATTSSSAAGTTKSGTTTALSTATTGAAIRQKITAEAGKALLAKTPGAVLLDVRTVAENKEIRIPGSTLIPVDELSKRLSELPKDPAKPIVIYCRSGNRSATAADILAKAGFPAVYDMGGIIDWPYETEKG